jgi:F0F1-type ATP synthase assembly protein I
MSTKREPPSPLVEAHRYSGLGCLFAAGVLAFMGGGWLLDRWLNTLPVFTVVGALGGAILSTVSIYRRLIGDTADASAETEGS